MELSQTALPRPRTPISLLSLAALAMFACSDSDSDGGEQPIEFGDGASEGAEVKLVVSALSGGSLSLPTRASVMVPPGALREDTEIGLRRPPDEEARKLIATLPDQRLVASAPYVLTPHGLTFKEPVEVQIPVGISAELESLTAAWLEDEEDTSWEMLDKPSIANGVGTIAMTHFSVVVLLKGEGGVDAGATPGDDDPKQDPKGEPTMSVDAGGQEPTGPKDAGSTMAPKDAGPGADSDAGTQVMPDAGGSQDGGPTADAGASGRDAAISDAGPGFCGDGVLDPNEACDVQIPIGVAGACPTTADCSYLNDECVDGVLNTSDPCNPTCEGQPFCAACGDGYVFGGENCDTAIPAGDPGACPTVADCDAMDDPCNDYYLINQGPCYSYCDFDPTC